MNRQERNKWILIGVVVILGLAAVAEQVRERMSVPKPLLAGGAEAIHDLVLESPGQPRRHLQRVRGRWELVEPFRVPASDIAVQALLAVASAPTRGRHDADYYEGAATGLDAPVARLALGARQLSFGGTDTLTGQRYVRVGDQVATIPDPGAVLTAPPQHFVDPRPFRPLRDLADAVLDGRALGVDARARLAGITATQVVDVPSTGAARKLDVTDSRERRLGFRVVVRPDGVWLDREDIPVAYALPADAAALFTGE